MVKKKKISRRKFLALSWMDGSKIYIFPEYRRSTQKWRGFESECNLAVPRTSNLLKFLSFLLGHRTQCIPVPFIPPLLRGPPPTSTVATPPPFAKVLRPTHFLWDSQAKLAFYQSKYPTGIGWFFHFSGSPPSLCSVIRSIKSFWVSFSSHRGRIFQVRSKETPKEMLGELTIRLRMYFPYNKCDNQNLSEIFFVLYT